MFGRTKAQQAPAPAAETAAPPAEVARAVAPATAEVTLGALRSEFDQNRTVAAPFTAVAEVTEQILDLYRTGRMEQLVALQALSALRLVDQAGANWALGATTRRWQRRLPSGTWRVAVPPAVSEPALEQSCAVALSAVQDILGVDAQQPTAHVAETVSAPHVLDAPAPHENDVQTADEASNMAALPSNGAEDDAAQLLAEFVAFGSSGDDNQESADEGYGYGV